MDPDPKTAPTKTLPNMRALVVPVTDESRNDPKRNFLNESEDIYIDIASLRQQHAPSAPSSHLDLNALYSI